MNLDGLLSHLRSGHKCVRINTHEESECVQLAVEAAMSMGLDVFTYSVTSGIRAAEFSSQTPKRLDTETTPAGALRWFLGELRKPAMLITLDLGDQLADSINLRAFRDLLEAFTRRRNDDSCIVMIDHNDNVPPVIGGMSVRYEIEAPTDSEIEQIVRQTLLHIKQHRPIEAKVSPKFLAGLVQNLRGLTRRQIRFIIHESVAKDGHLNDEDLPAIQRRKRRLLEDAGVLDFVEAPTSLDDIGGLAKLKVWLKVREVCFSDPTLPTPRGLLLLGVQGAGKSLASKAIATAWQRPLMRLDPGALFNKYVGETERNLRDALRQAEAMAPVVLWIDEIEKGFASAASTSTDGGVSRRMFGTLLTWMQEHQSPVFLVATANDIEALPPELLRKGRFDEIFFVDLPGPQVREVIFRIHLKKRGYQPGEFDLSALAAATDGYSGAEIEQAVMSAHLTARAANTKPKTQDIVAIAQASPPLSVTMAEKISDLREWAVGRCVPAD
jgi:hypothetical protein